MILLFAAAVLAGCFGQSDDARLYRHAARLMDRIVVLDTHCDFPECRYYHPEEYPSIAQPDAVAQITLDKMKKGHMNSVYMATYMSPLYGDQLDARSIAEAPAVVWNFIDDMDAHFASFPDRCGIARSREDAVRLRRQGKAAFFYGLENGYWIGDDLSNLEKLRDRGFTYITLCHWRDNIICHSSNYSADPSLGLTDFGRDVIREMNRLGIVVDISHTSYGTQREVIELSQVPVVYTHSGCSAVFPSVRNVDDETLKALAAKGGVIQVCFVKYFMAYGDEAQNAVTIDDYMEHLLHAIDVAGIDHVGVGLDFDGGGGGPGLNGADDAINLTVELLRRGFSDRDIAKIWGGNYLRVLSAAQSFAKQ